MSGPTRTIDELLDRAIQAINSGDRATASALAEQVLAVDSGNQDAEDLLAAPAAGSGEFRRLTILFADVVDSTALSGRVEPEIYRQVIGRYRQQVNEIVEPLRGPRLLDQGRRSARRVRSPEPTRTTCDERYRRVSTSPCRGQTQRAGPKSRFGFEHPVRVGVHRGLVYLDVAQDDVYGLGANLASRVSGLAPPGSVVVSEAIAPWCVTTSTSRSSRPNRQRCRRARSSITRSSANGSAGNGYRSARWSAATVRWNTCRRVGRWRNTGTLTVLRGHARRRLHR